MSIQRLPNWQIPNIQVSDEDVQAVKDIADWLRIHHIEHDEESANVALDFEKLVIDTIYSTNVESTTITTTNITVSSSITIGGTTASRLLATNSGNTAVSTDLFGWVAGIPNQVNIANDNDGTITLSLPQDIHTSASPTFVTAKLTTLTDGYVPYHVVDATGLANSDIHYDGTDVSIFKDATSGENPLLNVYGYITAGTAVRYSSLLMDDTNDEFLIQAENNANHEGITIDLTESNQKFRIRQNSNYLSVQHNGTDVRFSTDDGEFAFQTDEGTDTNTYLSVYPKGNANAGIKFWDRDGSHRAIIYQTTGATHLSSADHDPLHLNNTNKEDVIFFENATDAGPNLYIYGHTNTRNTYIEMRITSTGHAVIMQGGDNSTELQLGAQSTGILTLGYSGTGGHRYVWIKDEYILSFGMNQDYSIGWDNAKDKLQFIDGSTQDTNVRAEMDATGLFTFYKNIALKTTGEIRFYDDDNSHYVGFEAPALSANQIWVLPDADGPANEIWGTDGSGNLTWRDHGEIAGLGDDDHTIYSLVDGTRAFTGVVGGVFPTAEAHLATKEYVDDSIGIVLDYHFNNTTADINEETETTYNMESIEYAGEENITRTAITSASNQLLYCFATLAGEPGGIDLPHGGYDAHFHLEVSTDGGARTVDVYWTLSSIDADGTNESESPIMTSETVAGVTGGETEYTIHAYSDIDVTIGSTERLLFKVYGNGNAGSNAIMQFHVEGDTGTHFTLRTTSVIFNTIYVRQDGSTPLTSGWDIGNYTLTANGLTIDGTFTDGTLSIVGGDISSAGTITATTLSGGNVTTGADPGHTHGSLYYTETEINTWRNSVSQTEMGYLDGVTSDIQTQIGARATKTTAAWNKSIGAGGDYPTWAAMIVAMSDLIAHAVTVTIKTGTTLTEICELKNKHGITKEGVITIQAEDYFPQVGLIPLATGATVNTLVDAGQAWGVNRFIDMWVFVVHGTGTDNGFVKITDSDATSITVAAWPGTQPDNTSRYIIVGALLDCGGTRDWGFDLLTNTSPIVFNGIGVDDSDVSGFRIYRCSDVKGLYIGIHGSDRAGIYALANLVCYFGNCGIVKNNTDNAGTHAGIVSRGNLEFDMYTSGISDNSRSGIYGIHGGFNYIYQNFGDNNGTWGTYLDRSSQAKITASECSGSSGNHSDAGTAGDNSADQASAYV